MAPRRLAAVVLNHRTADETCRAVSSLVASHRPPDHLIVVDNDVADECRAHFASPRAPNSESPGPSPEPRAPIPEVTYLHTGRNLGFSGGMNVGIRAALEAGADQVLLVNSDIVVSPECLGRLESALVDQPCGGIAGPLVLSHRHQDRVESAGIEYNRRTGRMRVLGVGTRAEDALSGPRGADPDASSARRGVDAVSGCLMLVAREVFDAIGPFDEQYFFGFEDLDFCLRAREQGFSTLVVGGAVAYHEGGRTIGRASSRRFYFAARNHLLVASRRGRQEGSGARACRLVWVVALSLAHAVTAKTGFLPGRLFATARGVRDHLSGRYGPDPSA